MKKMRQSVSELERLYSAKVGFSSQREKCIKHAIVTAVIVLVPKE